MALVGTGRQVNLTTSSGANGNHLDGFDRGGRVPLDPAEQDRRFALYFGVTRDEIAARGIEPDDYALTNARAGVNHVYEVAEQKLVARESLLPYWAPTPYVSKGVTIFAKKIDASLTVDATTVRIDDLADFHVECPSASLRVRRLPVWLGMGLRLDFGAQGWWNVQARYSPTRIGRARRAQAVLSAALFEAGARWE